MVLHSEATQGSVPAASPPPSPDRPTAASPSNVAPRSRRSLLAGLLGGVAGLLAGSLGRPAAAEAAAGDPLIIGNETNNAGTANTKLQTNSSGTAFYVQQNGTGTALRANAVGPGAIAGFFTSNGGEGISGVTANATKFGVYGGNDASSFGNGTAVRANGKQNHGLVATTANASANAVRAIHQATSGDAVAVWGETASAPGAGVVGIYAGTTGEGSGVWGQTDSPEGWGVVSLGDLGVAANAYIFGSAFISGDLEVTGTITKGGGSFKIDHPLDPANKYLVHSFVESPDMKTVYDGIVVTDDAGEAVVELPAWFEALNRDFRYQLTPIGRDDRVWIGSEIVNHRFVIRSASPRVKVSWQVTGIRHDPWAEAHRPVVEEPKSAADRGRYLHPTELRLPAAKRIVRKAVPSRELATRILGGQSR